MLGELTMTTQSDGHVLLNKNPSLSLSHGNKQYASFCSQTPWLQHATIRENILFGAPFDSERYYEVIECCALKPDLDMLQDNDLTEIGVR